MRWPDNSQRHAIYGQTGSGKTLVELFALSMRDWDRRPWIIADFKSDPSIARIPHLEEIAVTDKPPKAPGLYVVRPLPHEQDDMSVMLWRIWDRGRTGLMVDEAYMLDLGSGPRGNKAFNAILTQGRSKRIPVIAGAQRPSWLSPFFMSEASFHQVMHLQRPEDVKRMEQWVPGFKNPPLNYHSQYYDVARDQLTHLSPVPPEEEILDVFDQRMGPRTGNVFRGIVRLAPASRPQRRIM